MHIKESVIKLFKKIRDLEESTKFIVVIVTIVLIFSVYTSFFAKYDESSKTTLPLASSLVNASDDLAENKVDSLEINPIQSKESLNYSQSDINSWNGTLKNLKEIHPSWQKWNRQSVFYKNNKAEIQRINTVIAQRIANTQQILGVMKANEQIDTNLQNMINSELSLFREQESLVNSLNSKSDAYAEKLSSDIKQLKNDSNDYDDSTSDYVYTPMIPSVADNSATIADAAAKKQAACKKTVNQCMQDIGQNIVSFQGSAYSSAARAHGDECNSEYKKCMQ